MRPFLLLSFTFLTVVGCNRQPTSVPPAVIKVGHLRLLSASPLFLAVQENLFQQQGVATELRVIASGPEGNEALAAGNINIAFSILPSLLVANARAIPPDLVSIYGSSIDSPEINDHRILVAKDSKIKRFIDLRGKKIAVVGWPGMTSDVLELLDTLEQVGLTPKDLMLVGMPHGDMIAALEAKVVDAAASAEPFVGMGQEKGTVRVLDERGGFYYNGQVEVTTYLARRSWVDANLDATRGFVRSLEQARQRMANRQSFCDKSAPNFNMKSSPRIDFIAITSAQCLGLHLAPIQPAPTEQGLRHVAEQLVKRKVIPQVPDNLSRLVYVVN